MPAANESTSSPSPAFLDAFRARARATGGTLSFEDFMALALYHPEIGYYRRDQTRVGRSAAADFYTATSSGPLFGELISAACVKLLGERDPGKFTFVEIGAEPGGGVLAHVSHPFANACTIRVGEPIELSRISERLIVFSNELFDAQPFRRFVAREGVWRELGVALSADDRLTEIELAPAASAFPTPLRDMPATDVCDNYHIDLPLAAAALARAISKQTWAGLFVACDYGKSWRELTEATPHGTARAYHRHKQLNDLLAQPGEQDLTCHICWDWLVDALQENRFSAPAVESQEAFFIHHAGEFIARLTAAEATRLSSRKLSLMQLLHPANMGQKFQVLHALRE